MKKTIALLGLMLLSAQITESAEFSIRGGNQLRWARGNAYLQGTSVKVQEKWFENITDLSAAYGDLQLSIRHSLFMPSEFGEKRGGIEAIDFKQLEYRYSNLIMTAGNFYATVGRGLALNLYRDYTLNFDSNLEGVKIEYNSDLMGLLALRGRSYPSTSPEGSRVRENDLEGAMLRGSPVRWGTLAGYYFYTPPPDTTDPGAPTESYPETRMPGGYLDLEIAGVGLYAETALQYVNEPSGQETKDPYYGHYLALDYSGPGFGVVADFKDYNFKKFGSFTSGGVASSEPLAYQNPPIVQREFSTNLLAKHPHLPIFNDEVGFQIEGTFQPSDPLALTADFNRSSSHRGASLIPSLHEEDAPFWQFFLEGEYTFPENHYLRLDLGINEEVKVTGEQRTTYFWERKQSGAAEGTYYFDSRYSTTFHLETMHVEDVKWNQTFWEYYAAVTLSRAPWGGITIAGETTGDPEAGSKDHWLSAELDLNFLERHNLLLFVGQDRGGLKCTSGRCRYVDPFEGVKLSLRSTF